MPLFQVKPKESSPQVELELFSKIQRRRYQILVHSFLYYELDISLISDQQWQAWAEELVKLQKENAEISEKVIFSGAFRSFDASTGFDLPYRDEQIVNIAYRLLRRQASNGNEEAKQALEAIQRVRTIPAEYSGFKKNHAATKKPKTFSKREVIKTEQTKRKKLF